MYAEYYKDILNLVIRITGSVDDSEDITQETFTKAFLNIDKFKGESKLSTWIFSIAKNESFRFLKERKKRRFSDIEFLIKEAGKTESEDIQSENEKQDLIDQVKEGCLTGLLQCLSPYQRSAFVLSVLFKFSISETAAIIGKTGGATKALIFRARKNLKGFLCSNCSLYDPGNHCRCEDLISFSLNRGWIKKPSGKNLKTKPSIDTHAIAREINEFKKIATMYLSIHDHVPSKSFEKRLYDSLKKLKTNYVIKKRN